MKLKILYYLISIKFNKWFYKNRYAKLRILKWRKMQSVLKNSNFYKELAIQEKSLSEYPLMNKEKFMNHFDQINTVGIKLDDAFAAAVKAENSRDFSPAIKNITVGLSSGTSGNRGVFLASEKERAQWVAAVLDRVIGFRLKRRTVAFFLRANSNLYDSVKSNVLSFQFFDLLENIETHIYRLNKLQPTIIVAQPSMLIELAQEMEKGNLNIQPKKIISVAEVLYPEDQKYLTSVFKLIIHQVYQCTEGFLASTCKLGTLHFHEDLLVIEKQYIDKENKRFHPIITDLQRSSQPVVRYELNDIITEKKMCACGNLMLAIEQIEGRSDDILVFKNKFGIEIKLFPDFFRRAIILSSSSIRDYALIQTGPSNLSLFIKGSSDDYELARFGIIELLEKHEIENSEIVRLESNQLIKGNKLIRIKNVCRKTN